MDLATLDTRRGADGGFALLLRHPVTGQPIGASIRVLGKDSHAYQAKALELQRRRLDRARRSEGEIADPAMIRADATELLACCTSGWEGIELDGEAFPCNEGNATALYERFTWIREQVDEAIHDRANFLPGAASS